MKCSLDRKGGEISLDSLIAFLESIVVGLNGISIEEGTDVSCLEDEVQGTLSLVVRKLQGEGPVPNLGIIVSICDNST